MLLIVSPAERFSKVRWNIPPRWRLVLPGLFSSLPQPCPSLIQGTILGHQVYWGCWLAYHVVPVESDGL